MQKSFIIWLFLAVLVVLFASVNAAPVEVNFLFASASISLALVMVVPLFLGASLAYILDLIARRAKSREIKSLRNSLLAVESELQGLRATQAYALSSPGPDRNGLKLPGQGFESAGSGTNASGSADSGVGVPEGPATESGQGESAGASGGKKRAFGFWRGGASKK